MNNKGQVLVMFVLLLPILFLLIYFFISDVYLGNEKKELDRINNKLCNYYKKTNDLKKVLSYGEKMDNKIIITIKENEDNIEIKLLKEKELFNKKNKIKSRLICK